MNVKHYSYVSLSQIVHVNVITVVQDYVYSFLKSYWFLDI